MDYTYEAETGSWYFGPHIPGGSAKQVIYDTATVILDMDAAGNVIGVEVLAQPVPYLPNDINRSI